MSAGVGPRSLARSAVWADGINGFELDPSPGALATAADAHPRRVDRRGTDRAARA